MSALLLEMKHEQDRRITETVERERSRLLSFIRRHVPAELDPEDILQDVFYELVETYRLLKPLEQAGAWLFRVARNRIIDRFRGARDQQSLDETIDGGDGEAMLLGDLLPSPAGGPEAEYARRILLEELEAALDELPQEQREVFVAHEIEGATFRELAEATGISINTLLARKRYAVLHLRRRLAAIHEEFSTGRKRS